MYLFNISIMYNIYLIICDNYVYTKSNINFFQTYMKYL